MKPWQTQGEVQDSDEEECNIQPEFPESERPSKRIKYESQFALANTNGCRSSGHLQAHTSESIRQPGSSKLLVQSPANKNTSHHDADRASLPASQLVSSAGSQEITWNTSQGPQAAQTNGPQPVTHYRAGRPLIPVIQIPRIAAIDSEPLSSPLSERDVSPPPGFRLWSPERDSVADLVQPDRVVDVQPLDLDWDAFEDTAIDHDGRKRTLRTRQKKQLHPYMYDKAQYQLQCRERGLQPIRIAEQSSQNQETQDSSVPGSSPPVLDHTTPDLETVIQRTGHRSGPVDEGMNAGLGYFDHESDCSEVYSADPRRGRLPQVRSRGFWPLRTDDSCLPEADPGFDSQGIQAPVSPPNSSSQSKDELARQKDASAYGLGFRLTFGRTPAALPTPQVSSTTKAREEWADPGSSESSAPLASTARRRAPIVVSSESEGTTTDSEVAERRLRQNRKRIKGVLPASWLKIDLQTQKLAKPISRDWGTDGTRTYQENHRGVARKIVQSQRRHNAHDDLSMTIDHGGSSDEGSDSDQAPITNRATPSGTRTDRLPAKVLSLDDDVMENDWVDPMLSDARNPKGHRKRLTKQTCIGTFMHQQRNEESAFSEERLSSTHEARRITRGNHAIGSSWRGSARQSTSKPFHLSIADAPSLSGSEAKTPQFVRLALRTVRHRVDKGRHSPRRKVIRLATSEDTEEATSVLVAWKQGKLLPRSDKELPWQPLRTPHRMPVGALRHNVPRTPLSEVQANRQNTPASSRATRISHIGKVVLQYPYAKTGPNNVMGISGPRSRRRAAAASGPSLLTDHATRPRKAQLEALETDFFSRHRGAAFEQKMRILDGRVSQISRGPSVPSVPLLRFLEIDPKVPSVISKDEMCPIEISRQLPLSRRRPRKKKAHRIDTSSHKYLQLPDPSPQEESREVSTADFEAEGTPILRGLRPAGWVYPVDFGLFPLPVGTCFDPRTFVGSGDFEAAMLFQNCDFDRARGSIRILVLEKTLEWDAWTEEVASELQGIPLAMQAALSASDLVESTPNGERRSSSVERNIDYLLRSTVRYITSCLYFLDRIDRKSCIQSLHDLCHASRDIAAQITTQPLRQRIAVCILQYTLVLAHQASVLSKDTFIESALRNRGEALLIETATLLADVALDSGLGELNHFYSRYTQESLCEAPVDDDTSIVASIVLLKTVLASSPTAESRFWSVIARKYTLNPDAEGELDELEERWHMLFCILPALEIDAAGIVRSGERMVQTQEDWTLIGKLVKIVLRLYDSTSHDHRGSINDYLRTILRRCHILVTNWGWRRCETILGTFFDFFAQRKLSFLHKEDCRGSPQYLTELNKRPSLAIANDDRSFHMFLKLLATSLLSMRSHKSLPERRIGAIAWRLIPSHHRSYPKEADLNQYDLDSLRNHHDLLSTLYFVSPPGYRPNVDIIRNLVDYSSSHLEACRLSVRAWANITAFQVSTKESLDTLEPLIDWFGTIVKDMTAQYRLARTEVEKSAEEAGALALVSSAIREAVIANNQVRVLSVLIDALAGLKRALQASESLLVAERLITRTSFWAVLDLFDPGNRRLSNLLNETMDVFNAFLDVCNGLQEVSHRPVSNDDSQDYGDFSALEEYIGIEDATEPSTLDSLFPIISKFVSNVVGADIGSDDELLKKAIDVWLRMGFDSPAGRTNPKAHYLDNYSAFGWCQMRDTPQKRKFSPYVMSCISGHSPINEDTKHSILSGWLVALVQREATLKFQHTLTSALLNEWEGEPMLRNLPFSRDSHNGLYKITLTELRHRRLALLSSVLSNIRSVFDEAVGENSRAVPQIRADYGDMLRKMMHEMKANYRDLQTDTDTEAAATDVQGAYIEFVQQVVSFLQQHTGDICPVDRFFTDSAAFPLPTNDPAYVIGRLRSYAPKLDQAKARTQLACFVHSVIERAVVDGRQAYLINQLSRAMCPDPGSTVNHDYTLRQVLLTAILPSYIDEMYSTDVSWILAVPVLQACESALAELFYTDSIDSNDHVQSAGEILAVILGSLNRQLFVVRQDDRRLKGSSVLRSLSTLISVGASTLTLVSYLASRNLEGGLDAESRLHALFGGVLAVRELLLNSSMDVLEIRHPIPADHRTVTSWPDTKAVCDAQIRQSMKDWHLDDSGYRLQRNNSCKRVVVDLDAPAAERARLLQTIAKFELEYRVIHEPRRCGSAKRSEQEHCVIDDIFV